MLGNIIGGFIIILVGTSLLPTIADQVTGAQLNGNVSSAASTLVGMITLFYALSIVAGAVLVAALGLRNSGLI